MFFITFFIIKNVYKTSFYNTKRAPGSGYARLRQDARHSERNEGGGEVSSGDGAVESIPVRDRAGIMRTFGDSQ